MTWRLSLMTSGTPAFLAPKQAAGRIPVVLLMEDFLTVTHRRVITALASERHLPAVFGLKQFVEAGGLMSYAPSHAAVDRRVAAFVDKILQGARPADLPVEQPTEYELVLNRTTARALGLTLPPAPLLRADQVVEQCLESPRSGGGLSPLAAPVVPA